MNEKRFRAILDDINSKSGKIYGSDSELVGQYIWFVHKCMFEKDSSGKTNMDILVQKDDVDCDKFLKRLYSEYKKFLKSKNNGDH